MKDTTIDELFSYAFYDGSYSEYIQFLDHVSGKEFKGSFRDYDIIYKIEKTELFVNSEDLISRTAFQHHVEKPYLYCPYSRKAVKFTVL